MKSIKNFTLIICLIFILCLFSRQVVFAIGEISSTVIDPLLNISVFSPYKIKSIITGSPISVLVDISGINGNLINDNYWNYYVDGTPNSDIGTKTMTYDAGEEKWISEDIYPDDIYPEIFFAPSDITWNNAPSNIVIRRNNYHIMHFQNSFTMAASSSFFIELNVIARANNSQNLLVYLVGSGEDDNYFTNDWRSKSNTELVATIYRSDSFHHTHTENSKHRLIPLLTNADGTVGEKHLDINGDFWIVLYSNSPNDNLGWNLRYHDSSLCDNKNNWFIASNSGWTMTHQSGCPDAHIHLARRGPTYIDGARAVVTANFDDGSTVSTSTFSFGNLPNLAPNPSNFISPVLGGIYYGDNLEIRWATSTDPNNDPLTYNIYLFDGISTTTLISTTTEISFIWDISSVGSGDYYLSGEVCDESLCTDFNLIGKFRIEKESTIYSLTNISIFSDNSNSGYAKQGDEIFLTFTSSGDVSGSLNINLYSGGSLVVGECTTSSIGNDWIVNYTIQESDVDGPIDFVISADNLDMYYSDTDHDSYVIVDLTLPIITILGSNPVSIYQNQTYTDFGATASDNIDGDITSSIVVTNNVNTSIISPYTVTYVVSDTAGNISTSIRVVNVISQPVGSNTGSTITIDILNSMNQNQVQQEISKDNYFTKGLWKKINNISTVYFINEHNKTRHIYPSEVVWKSYFGKDFSFVEKIEEQDLSNYTLGKNITFKRETLFKIPSVPKVYVVSDDNGLIQWIKTEEIVRRLYGNDWNKLVYDLSEAFFGDYIESIPIE